MPNRILKESICTSGTVSKLSLLAQVLYIRLIVTCDDYGLFMASEPVILGRCFPYDPHHFANTTVRDVLEELSHRGMVHLYHDRDRPFGQILNFSVHNPPRASRPKYPLPEKLSEDLEIVIKRRCPALLMQASCSQVESKCLQAASKCSALSNTNTNTNTNTNRSYSYSEEIKNTPTILPTTEPELPAAPPKPVAQDAGPTPLGAALALADDMRGELIAVRPKARLASAIAWDNARGAWAQALLPLLERDGLEHARIMATWRATIGGGDGFELGNMLHPQAPARFVARFDELEAKSERRAATGAARASSPTNWNFDMEKYLEEHPECVVDGWDQERNKA